MQFTDKNAEEQIKLISKLVHESPIGYVAINENLDICMTNRKICEMTNYSAYELYGANVNILLDDLKHEAHTEHLKKWFKHPVPLDLNRRGQLYMRSHEGKLLPVKIQVYDAMLWTKNGMFQVNTEVTKPTLFGIASIIFQ